MTTTSPSHELRLAEVVPLALDVRGCAEELLDVLFEKVATDPSAEHAWRLAGSVWEASDELVARLTEEPGSSGPFLQAA
jgi:hypothetical protein